MLLNPFFEEESRTDNRQALYLNGRPVGGPHLYDLETCGEMRAEFLKLLKTVQAQGGVLVVPFAAVAERSALIFLNIVAGGLLHKGEPVHFTQFADVPVLSPPAEGSLWLIHNAASFPDLAPVLERWLKPGRAAILSGADSSLNLSSFNFPSIRFVGFDAPSSDFEKEEAAALQAVLDILAAKERTAEENISLSAIHRCVALGDAWGAAIPLALLARCLETDEDTIAPVIEELFYEGEDGVLYWLEREKPPTLMVSTRSESYARRFLAYFADIQAVSLNDYHVFVQSICPDLVEERYFLLQLFGGLLSRGRFRREIGPGLFDLEKIRKFMQGGWNRICAIIAAGSPAEHLLWGLFLSRLGLIEQGLLALEQGMKKDKGNVYLRQAYARLLGMWSRTDESKGERAAAAFRRACGIDKRNVHVWQAWGVFEAERGEWPRAEYCFQTALQIDSQSVYVLAARADMHLDRGLLKKVEADIAKAKAVDAENLHIIHIQGRVAFYRGEWADASRHWQDLLKKDKRNAYALQSLGHMARVRGYWEESHACLATALADDPENEACLLEMGLLQQDRSFFTAEKEKEHFQQDALAYFNQALVAAPWNPKIIVALAVAERLTGEVKKAGELLGDLYRRLPNNDYVGHALALCDKDLGNHEAAIKQLKNINVKRQGGNIPVQFSLIEIRIGNGEKEAANSDLRNIIRHRLLGLSAAKKIEALLAAARLFFALGDAAEAKDAANEALQLDRENRRSRLIMERMQS